MIKKLIILLGVLVILVIIGGVVLYINKDKILRVGVERALSYVLEVDVTVGSASLRPMQGTVTLRHINIPNPPGYQSDHAMHFGEVHVEVDMGSLTSDTPTIRLIRIADPDIIYEKTLRSSNFRELIANAESHSTGDAGEPPADAPDEASMAFLIERIEVASTGVSIAMPYTGGESIGVQMPSVVLTNIGSESQPAMPADVIIEFLTALTGSITEVGGDAIAQLESLGGEVVDTARDTVEGVVGEATDTVGGVRDTVREGIGGILNRDRNSEN